MLFFFTLIDSNHPQILLKSRIDIEGWDTNMVIYLCERNI